jgi:DNA-binding MarR family transcriptional regulator
MAVTQAHGLGEVLEFMRVVWALDHALQSRSKRMTRTVGVTGPQRLVLRIIGRFPGLPAGQLAELLHLHPSTLTGILQRLERRKLVRRSRDLGDRRRALLTLTSVGRRFDRETEGTVESAVATALGRAPARKVAAAREVLMALAAALLEPSP